MGLNPDKALGRIKHFLSSRDLTLGILIDLMKKTLLIKKISKKPGGARKLKLLCDGKQICNIFYQPSTRTRASSFSAAKRLGADVFEVVGTEIDGEYQLVYSSLYKKGAAFLDEMETYASYFDLLNIRAPKVGMPAEVAEHLDEAGYDVSVVNSGDGKAGDGEHPLQAFTDIYTFFGEFEMDVENDWRKLPNYSIAFINDCRSRVVRSNALLMGKLLRMELKFVFPEGFGLDPEQALLDELKESGVKFSLHNELQPASAAYVLRIPEDWLGKEMTEKILNSGRCFSITRAVVDKYGYQGVMHPFPRFERGNELPSRRTAGKDSLDEDKRAWYFKQIRNGVPCRMATFLTLLNSKVDLNRLDEQKLNVSFIGQCGNCGRLYNDIGGWGNLKPERQRHLPLLPLCDYCLRKKRNNVT